MENEGWQRKTAQGAIDFFAMGTQRVVSVVFYVEPLHYREGWLSQGHEYLEVINPRHKLSRLFDWRLMENWKPPSVSPNAMPPYWIRLSNFPQGCPHKPQLRIETYIWLLAVGCILYIARCDGRLSNALGTTINGEPWLECVLMPVPRTLLAFFPQWSF